MEGELVKLEKLTDVCGQQLEYLEKTLTPFLGPSNGSIPHAASKPQDGHSPLTSRLAQIGDRLNSVVVRHEMIAKRIQL